MTSQLVTDLASVSIDTSTIKFGSRKHSSARNSPSFEKDDHSTDAADASEPEASCTEASSAGNAAIKINKGVIFSLDINAPSQMHPVALQLPSGAGKPYIDTTPISKVSIDQRKASMISGDGNADLTTSGTGNDFLSVNTTDEGNSPLSSISGAGEAPATVYQLIWFVDPTAQQQQQTITVSTGLHSSHLTL